MGKQILNGNLGKMMLNGVVYGNNVNVPIDSINYKDVFNHGDIVGLNQLYNGWQLTNGSAPKFVFSDTDNTLTRSGGTYWSDNTTMALTLPFSNKNASRVCFDLAIPEGYTGGYMHASIGVVSQDDLFATLNDRLSENFSSALQWGGFTGIETLLIRYSDQYNIKGNDPWYQLPRDIFTVDIPSGEEKFYYPVASIGFGTMKIYSIWLE